MQEYSDRPNRYGNLEIPTHDVALYTVGYMHSVWLYVLCRVYAYSANQTAMFKMTL